MASPSHEVGIVDQGSTAQALLVQRPLRVRGEYKSWDSYIRCIRINCVQARDCILICEYSLVVEHVLAKDEMGVRFPLPAHQNEPPVWVAFVLSAAGRKSKLLCFCGESKAGAIDDCLVWFGNHQVRRDSRFLINEVNLETCVSPPTRTDDRKTRRMSCFSFVSCSG